MLKAIRVKLYLNQTQSNTLKQLLGCNRFVYNNGLAYKIKQYKDFKLYTTNTHTSKYLFNSLLPANQFLQDHNSKVYCQTLIDLEQNYKRFFVNGFGFPKFKSKRDVQSCRFPKQAVATDTFKNGKLNLTKTVKNLTFRCSDRDKQYLFNNKEDIRSITVKLTKTNQFYASILVDKQTVDKIVKQTTNKVGVDVGLTHYLTDSNAVKVTNPKWIRTNKEKLAHYQRLLCATSKGSRNRERRRLKLAKLHEKLSNQKDNFLHKLTSDYINDNQVICLEQLNIEGMLQNHTLARAVSEASWYQFRQQLEYKAVRYNREVITVSTFFPSSKLCSCCGYKNTSLDLSVRTWVCSDCSVVHDRDLNAATNILNEGLRLLNVNKTGGVTPLMSS